MTTDEAGSCDGFFPKACTFCNQYRKTVRRKSRNAYKILAKEAEQNIKRAANVKNDRPLLCQIQDVDLIAKELMIHKKCYLDYTRILDSIVKKATEELPRQLGHIREVTKLHPKGIFFNLLSTMTFFSLLMLIYCTLYPF